ncbi:MAG: DUF4974 domain-containing protein [Muribaculaceae bacterium]|nr:DUF4974 domain-containing protein [Muribaculaceae bacterium]
MTPQEIINILYKRLAGGTLSTDEALRLEKWIAENPGARQQMVDSISDVEHIASAYRVRRMIDTVRPREEMMRRLGITEQKKAVSQPKFFKAIRWAAAAVVVALVTGGIIFMMRTPFTATDKLADAKEVQPLRIENLSPGSTQAIVTVPSGDTLHVTETSTVAPKLAKVVEAGPLQIDVPRGGEFVVTLEDSTRVWLNSESRLIYPAHFSASSRRVELTGEAYFEVTHNPDVPFIVESANQRVRVYGTEFNIRSYPEDDAVYTTLSSGSVSLSPTSGVGEIFLSPGKQAVFTKETSEAKVRTVDIERVTGWRHGRFVFEEQSLRQIMRDLARWYDFEYEFADNDAAETIFMGSIPRYSNFKTAIAILEKSGGLTFEVKDNKILVSRQTPQSR